MTTGVKRKIDTETAGTLNDPRLNPQVYNANGKRLRILKTAHDVIISDQLITPKGGQEELDFRIPYPSDDRPFLEAEGIIRCDGSEFVIRQISDTWDTGSSVPITTVHCEANWYELGDFDPEVIGGPFYTAGAALTVFSLWMPGWTVGSLAGAGDGKLTIRNKVSPLTALRLLPQAFGGELWFDNINRTINISPHRGSTTAVAMYAHGRNMMGNQRNTDTSGLVTRLYAYGAREVKGNGQLGAPITLATGVPGGDEYIEDYSFYDDNGKPRKIRAAIIQSDTISTQPRLMAWARANLARMSQPGHSYVIQQSNTADHDVEAVLGDVVRIHDDLLGMDISARVRARQRNILQPWNTKYTVDKARGTLSGSIPSFGDVSSGQGAVGNDDIPADPTGVTFVTHGTVSATGLPLLHTAIFWDAVTENSDGSDLTDLGHYDVQFKIHSLDWADGTTENDTEWQNQQVPGDTTASLIGTFPPSTIVTARVRAVDVWGNAGDWTLHGPQTLTKDLIPPNAPSAPVSNPNNLPGVIEVGWDGLDDAADPMPKDFLQLTVHASSVSGFAPNDDNRYDMLASAGNTILPLATGNWYVRFIAYDTSGNPSDPSVQTLVTSRQIVNTDIIDQAITAAKIALAAVGTAQIAPGAITAAQIASQAVGTLALANGAVTAGQIANAAITAVALANNAVTAPAILAGAVGTTALANNAVTSAQIAASAVTATQLANNAVTSVAINAGAVLSTKLGNGAVGTTQLASNAVTAAILANGAVGTTQLANGAVTAGQLAIAAINGTGGIANNAVTASTILAGAIGTGALAAGAVTTAILAANAVTAGTIQAGAIGTAALAANCVTAGQIAADTITAGQIAANAISASELAANAVYAGSVQAGAIGTTALAAQSVTAAVLAAGAVTAENLTVGAIVEGLFPNGGFEDASNTGAIAAGWTAIGAGAVRTNTAGAAHSGAWCLSMPANAVTLLGPVFPASPGDVVALSGWAKNNSGVGAFWLGLLWLNAAGGTISQSDIVSGAATAAAYQRSFGQLLGAPAGTVNARIKISNTGANSIYIDDIDAYRVIGSAQIANAAILTANIADAQILQAKIGDLQINTAKISDLNVGKLTAGTLGVDVVIGARIKTADTGARSELNSTGFHLFNSGNAEVLTAAIVAGVPTFSVTGGQIIGGLIQTSSGNPRVELSATDNAINIYDSAGHKGQIYSNSANQLIIYPPSTITSGVVISSGGSVTLPPAASFRIGLATDFNIDSLANVTAASLVTNGTGGLTVQGGGSSINGITALNQTSAANRILVMQCVAGNSSSYWASVNSAGTTISRCDSTGNVGGAGTYTTISDRRTKRDVRYVTDRDRAIDVIRRLKPARFAYKHDDSGEMHHGWIAQDLQKVLPEAVVRWDPEDKTKTLASRDGVILTTAVLALQNVIDRLERLEAAR